jgi:hypothetical protein
MGRLRAELRQPGRRDRQYFPRRHALEQADLRVQRHGPRYQRQGLGHLRQPPSQSPPRELLRRVGHGQQGLPGRDEHLNRWRQDLVGAGCHGQQIPRRRRRACRTAQRHRGGAHPGLPRAGPARRGPGRLHLHQRRPELGRHPDHHHVPPVQPGRESGEPAAPVLPRRGRGPRRAHLPSRSPTAGSAPNGPATTWS